MGGCQFWGGECGGCIDGLLAWYCCCLSVMVFDSLSASFFGWIAPASISLGDDGGASSLYPGIVKAETP